MVNLLIKKQATEIFCHPPLNRFLCWKGSAKNQRIALTFDDGPNPEYTPRVLECLEAHGVRATFFVLGARIRRYTELLERIVAGGHEVGIHGYDHTRNNLVWQCRRTHEFLASRGVDTRLFRPPFGHIDMVTSLWMIRHGWSTILWSFDTMDSMRCEGKAQQELRYGELVAGDIVLMHDDNAVCMSELPQLIERARANGLEPGTVSDLLL